MSRNPILTDKAFDPANYGSTATTAPQSPAEEWNQAQAMQAGQQAAWATNRDQYAPAGPVETTGRTMTVGGVASATLVLFVGVLVGGWFGWMSVTQTPIANPLPDGPTATAELNQPVLLFVALFVALGFAIFTSFKPQVARFTAPLYALAEGYVLGAISHLYDAQWNGIVVQAVLATGGVFLAMLVIYSLRILRVTPRLTKGIIAATFGIFALYMVGWIASLFGARMSFLYDASPFSILLSVLFVGVAAFNLLLDFDFIERGAQSRLPAYMDWYGAFGLLVTLVWLYLEMLRLLAKLRSN